MIRQFRHLLIAIALAVVWVATAAAIELSGPAPVLHKQVLVDTDVVRLGDLFDGTGAAAETVVAYAPQPGRRAIFDANWLGRVAREHGLPWRPRSRLDRVTVERASTIVSRAEIEEALLLELSVQGYGDDYQLALNNAGLRVHIPADQPASIAVDNLSIDPRSGRLTAILRIPADNPQSRRVNVTGRLFAVVAVPVPSRPLHRGERIRAEDITIKQVPSAKVRANTITDPAALVGMAPRRALSAGVPVSGGDLGQPLLVERGSTVTMVFQTATMTLTATGRALDAGSRGELIRVQNSHSQQTIDATVLGAGRVAVTSGNQIAMQAGAPR